MTSVLLRVQISGTRDGVDWPPPGSVIDLPDQEAADLIINGMALDPAATEDGDVETATEPTGDVETTKAKRPAAKKAAAPKAD